MKTLVNNTTGVNFKLLSFLLALTIVLRVVASTVSPSHPLLGMCFMVLETVGWICIGQIWAFELIKGIQQWGPKVWTRIWTFARMHVRVKKAQQSDTFVPVEQLELLRNNVQRLGLALHGLTPEMETARRTHFQMHNEAVPAPILPPQNAVLYAEFSRLTRFLNHFGFPHLESVRLQQKDFEFARSWGSNLEARLQQTQKQHQYQQQAMEWTLGEACKTLEAIGTRYPQAQDDAGYQRIQGALKLLKKMARNSHCPSEQVTSFLTALLEDMESLRKQLKQAAA